MKAAYIHAAFVEDRATSPSVNNSKNYMQGSSCIHRKKHFQTYGGGGLQEQLELDLSQMIQPLQAWSEVGRMFDSLGQRSIRLRSEKIRLRVVTRP